MAPMSNRVKPSFEEEDYLSKSNFTNTNQQSINFAFLNTPSLLKLENGNPLGMINVFVHFV